MPPPRPWSRGGLWPGALPCHPPSRSKLARSKGTASRPELPDRGRGMASKPEAPKNHRSIRADASCRGGTRREESEPAWVGFAARLLLVPSLERAAWWSVRRAQNRKPATYRCPLCGSYLPALVEHVLIAPEGESAGRRHAHTHCVLQARRAGRLPTREDWQRTQPRRPSRWRRLLRFGGGGT